MRHPSIDNDLDLPAGAGSVTVQIEYEYTPGEPRVMYYRDGSGYPGSPAYAELIDVTVVAWHVSDETRKRTHHWIWLILDAFAREIIESQWDRIGELCLQHAECEKN